MAGFLFFFSVTLGDLKSVVCARRGKNIHPLLFFLGGVVFNEKINQGTVMGYAKYRVDSARVQGAAISFHVRFVLSCKMKVLYIYSVWYLLATSMEFLRLYIWSCVGKICWIVNPVEHVCAHGKHWYFYLVHSCEVDGALVKEVAKGIRMDQGRILLWVC